MAKREKKQREMVFKQKIPTGSSILDIALEGGWDIGGLAQIYADSRGGKTLFACTALYEALLKYSPAKVKYRYNDVEAGLTFDTKKRYGYPLLGSDHVIHEPIIESMKADILDFCDTINTGKDEIGIYIVDSQDLLQSLEDKERTEEERKSYKKTGEAKNIGTYGNRAKKLKETWRHTILPAYESNVHIMVISQIIDKIGAMPFEKKTTTTGGHGTKFASSKRFEIKRVCDLGPKDRPWGFRVCVTLEKTRTQFEGRKVYIDVITDTGFDDVRSSLLFLYDILDEKGKEIAGKGDALKWSYEYNPVEASEAEDITTDDYKAFCEEIGITDAVREEYGSLRVGNMKKYISGNPEVMTAFVEKYGVMSLDDMAVYIEENDLEDELARRVKMKWDWLETKDKPKNRKKKPMIEM